MKPVPRSPYPGEDLLAVVRVGVEREGVLLAAGEGVVLAAVEALSPEGLELMARLHARESRSHWLCRLPYAPEVVAAAEELVERGLAHDLASPSIAAEALPLGELRRRAREAGLRATGDALALAAALSARGALPRDLLTLRHRALVARLQRLSGLDPTLSVLERLGRVRWAEYEPTPGPGAYADRRAMVLHERAAAGDLLRDEARAIAAAGPPPWGRSAWRLAVEQVLAADPTPAELAAIPGQSHAAALALHAAGRSRDALDLCRRGSEDPALAIALHRTGRRIARASRAPWPPAPPLRSAPERRLWLRRAGTVAGRPAWDSPAGPVPVEDAVIAHVRASGRDVVRAENALWTSIFALCFRELYWLPLPGRLPARRMAGPLDLGTPAFYASRRERADAIIDRVRRGDAGALAAEWRGEVLAGLGDGEGARAVADRIGGDLAAAVAERMLREGWRAAKGLPDLLVLGGPLAKIPDAIPGALGQDAILVEVKGPTDKPRDDQVAWMHYLLTRGVCVEIWYVTDT